ncbi:generative cell specific-1 [Chlorella sorokiniana]|uniref:Generative cell specific-1 n=1 Tax=Chlorella sorokiniana TaxID=3076 RepID=A0A2P6TVX6_CHLSO|nr:generative cell specific-1 [Chlorella sorokiniana]|eukprot:PRW58208.1 generative cell specific-1 [Chlorella sorokiniana]
MAGRRAAALVLLAGLAGVTQAGVIAVGSLQSCVNDGTNAAISLECQEKIVVTINIEDSSLYQTEELSFSVSCVNSTTGSCPCGCDYTKDPGCSCRNLEQDIRVSLQKTPVYASYPLTAHRAPFNGAPFEDAREVGKCEAGEYAQFPSCGWAKDPNTQADIPFSQGFCCTCSSYSSATDLKRKAIQCGGLLGWGNTQSAHCLRFSPDWWHAGFRIGEFALKFRINLNVTTVTPPPASGSPPVSGSPPGAPAASPPPPGSGSSGNSSSRTEILSLTPSLPSQRDASKRVSARLVGDLIGYQQEAQLDSKWLMIPFGAGVSQIAYQDYLPFRRDEWMIVDANQVSVDGTECNKIGTSYAAFRNAQGPNVCRSPQGACLANQLRDLYIADQQRMNRGETPLYLIGRYGGGPQNGEQVDFDPNNGQLSLNLPVPGMRTSIVSLSVAADDVKFVVNNSPANITRAQVCTYGGTKCGGFEAMTTQGYLYVDVRNTGYLAASYIISVTECTSGVMPVVAQHASIDAQSTATLVFQLRMETDQGTNSSCTVTVTDSLGGVASTQGFNFYTNATKYDKPPDESELDPEKPPPGGPTTDWCQLVCPNILDLKCSALKGCFGRLSKGIAAIVGPLTALLALVFAYRTGYLQLLFRALSAVLFTSRPAATKESKDSQGSKAGGKKSKSKRRQARSTSEGEEEEDGTQ